MLFSAIKSGFIGAVLSLNLVLPVMADNARVGLKLDDSSLAKYLVLSEKPELISEFISEQISQLNKENYADFRIGSDDFFNQVELFRVNLDAEDGEEIILKTPQKCGVSGCPHYIYKLTSDSAQYLGFFRMKSFEDFRISDNSNNGFYSFYFATDYGFSVYQYDPKHAIYSPK